jgi:hypothetical protein
MDDPVERKVWDIPFPNSKIRDEAAIKDTFASKGLSVAAIQVELRMWTWVLCEDGSLWLHDMSHGGGGVFQLHSK